ncbi:unnamed protein product [Eretmochelys imbricata]
MNLMPVSVRLRRRGKAVDALTPLVKLLDDERAGQVFWPLTGSLKCQPAPGRGRGGHGALGGPTRAGLPLSRAGSDWPREEPVGGCVTTPPADQSQEPVSAAGWPGRTQRPGAGSCYSSYLRCWLTCTSSSVASFKSLSSS